MKMKLIGNKIGMIVILSSLALSACSFDGKEILTNKEVEVVKQAGKQLGQFAGDVAQKVVENKELQQALMDTAKVSASVASRFLEQAMKDPQIQEAARQLGDQAVQEVIAQVVKENGGTMNEKVISLIAEELKKRMGA